MVSIMVKSKFGSAPPLPVFAAEGEEENQEEWDSFRNGLSDLNDVGLILTGILTG